MKIIAGPTASGKTDLAIKIALENNAYIINADALQLYKDLKILTAYPTETQNVPHLGFGLLKPYEESNVIFWNENVQNIIKNYGENYILVGGTGFYIKTFLEEGLSQIPSIPLGIKQYARNLSKEQLHHDILKHDPDILQKIHVNDTQRLSRALCVKLATGRSIQYFQNKSATRKNIPTHFINPSSDMLHQQINQRVLNMLQKGVIEEVQDLRYKYPTLKDLPISKVIGVKEILAYLNHELSLDETIERIQLLTRQYAKRQLTFFRNIFRDLF